MAIPLSELLQEISADNESAQSWMPEMASQGGPVALTENDPPRVHQIVQVLRDNPILIEPTLSWLNSKQGEISAATLQILYTPEQLEALKKRLEV